MQIMQITLEFNLADLVAQNEINVPAAIVLTQPQFEPPPPDSHIERLRCEFTTIMPLLTKKSHDILEFMLAQTDGQATYEELADNAWNFERYPTESCVRQAVHRLRAALKKFNVSHLVFGSRAGVYSFVPALVKCGKK